jgi:hypothetical protein
MGLYSTTVDSVTNSIGGGTAAVVTFQTPLKVGDVLTIQTPLTQTWSSGGGPGYTNADGVTVTSGSGPVQITWSSFNPGTPGADVVTTYPAASGYSFGVGCLVGSLDGGNSFFSVGTNFTTTVLGNGLLATTPAPSTKPALADLSLFFWDVNAGDNLGSLPVTVTVTRRAS